MRATVGNFEEWKSNFKEICLRLFVVVGVMETIYCACVPSFTSVYAAVLVLKKIAWGFSKQYGDIMETRHCHGNDLL